jgi:hypothetical protein
MSSRYQGISILKDKDGKRYLRGVKYPDVPVSDDDIYIISVVGDTIDLLADDYYKKVDDWWIIAVANNLKGDSRFIPAGTQLRIPADVEGIKKAYNTLNGIV